MTIPAAKSDRGCDIVITPFDSGMLYVQIISFCKLRKAKIVWNIPIPAHVQNGNICKSANYRQKPLAVRHSLCNRRLLCEVIRKKERKWKLQNGYYSDLC